MLDENIPRKRGRPRKLTPEEMAHRATEYDIRSDHNVRVAFLFELKALLAPLLNITAGPVASDAVLQRNAATIRAGVANAVQLIDAELE